MALAQRAEDTRDTAKTSDASGTDCRCHTKATYKSEICNWCPMPERGRPSRYRRPRRSRQRAGGQRRPRNERAGGGQRGRAADIAIGIELVARNRFAGVPLLSRWIAMPEPPRGRGRHRVPPEGSLASLLPPTRKPVAKWKSTRRWWRPRSSTATNSILEPRCAIPALSCARWPAGTASVPSISPPACSASCDAIDQKGRQARDLWPYQRPAKGFTRAISAAPLPREGCNSPAAAAMAGPAHRDVGNAIPCRRFGSAFRHPALENDVFERAGYVPRMRVGHVIGSLAECSQIRLRNRGGRVNRNPGPAVPGGCPQGQRASRNA